MTFVGKILVIVILAFALFFLALSTVVFNASTNWRNAHDAVAAKRTEIQQQLTTAQNDLAAQKTALEKEIADRDARIASLDAQSTSLSNQIDTLQADITSLRTQVEEAQRTTQTQVQLAQATTAEAQQLREQFQAAQKVANDYAARQTELDERIFLLERQLDTATQNNEDLRNALADYQNYLESRGLPADPEQVRLAAQGTLVSPDIEGRVLRVANDYLEISLGSDDGVTTGQEYFVFRTGDSPQYIGKIRITLTEADKAVGRLVFSNLGRKVMEGDSVAGKIQPRS
jgi:predicted RNase H-like nuclease (RuvC/YqgF family)